MPQKNNNMSSLSSTSANKSSSMIHESPKDHSINIENAAPYYQGKCSYTFLSIRLNVAIVGCYLNGDQDILDLLGLHCQLSFKIRSGGGNVNEQNKSLSAD